MSGTGVVSYQPAGILSAVQFGQINAFCVGTPGDIRQVFLFRQTGFQPDDLFRREMIDADRYLVTFHPGHRIFERLGSGDACIDMYDRVIRNHRFVHAIESQRRTVGRPEEPFVDTELVLVHGCTADNAFIRLIRYRFGRTVGRKNTDIIFACECDASVCLVIFPTAACRIQCILRHNVSVPQIVMHPIPFVLEGDHGHGSIRYKECRHGRNLRQTGCNEPIA